VGGSTRSNQALSQLPPEVNQVGLTITKQSSNTVLIVNLTSPNGTFDQAFLQNYADIHITDRLARINGVASINNFGLRKYAMRIWLDPAKLANMGMAVTDIASRCGMFLPLYMPVTGIPASITMTMI
jgi:HAE1 family hydrophobic/amphiphilic exporter-1